MSKKNQAIGTLSVLWNWAENAETENYGTSKARSIADRIPCVTGEAKHGVVNAPFLVKNYGGNKTRVEVSDPVGTVTQQDG